MRIARVKISNILGIEELEFEAGKFNEITGKNGLGKTAVIEALKSVVKGGEDATLLRRGAKAGEVVLVIHDDDDDSTTTVKHRRTEKTTTLSVERNGVKMSRPAETLKALTDALSVNPVEFLRAPPAKRVNVLLESLPMVADAARMSEIVGHDVPVDGNLHALTLIEAVRKQVFDERTGTNRAIREKDSTINQLTATLPDGEVEVPAGAEDLVAQLDQVDAEKQAELDRIRGKLDGLRAQSNEKKEGMRESANTAIAEIEAQIATLKGKIDSCRTALAEDIGLENSVFSEIERKAAGQREKKLTEFAERRLRISSSLSVIQAAESQRARHEATRETVAQMRAEGDTLRADADRQTAALEGLDAYKLELLSNLPIPGLEVVEGGLFRGGIPFDRLNTAQQVEIAVEIAKLRAGKLAIACVDGIEALDGEHYETFKEMAVSSGLQLFVTRVSDGDFAINAAD